MTPPPLSASEARELAFEAYTYGFAIVENYRAMFGMCVWRDSPQYSGFNNYLHGRTLFDSSYDTVVNANNDTLYSTTFADLRAEPVVISVPPTDSRYFVIQLVDMGTDNFAYIGTRATGHDGGDFVLVGPRYGGAIPDVGDAQLIAAPSEFVALATRTAIDGPDDLDDVIAIQERLAIRPLSTYLGGEAPEATGVEFPPYSPDLYGSPRLLGYLNFLLQFHTVPAFETGLLRRLSRISVGPYLEFDLDAFSDDEREAVREGSPGRMPRSRSGGTTSDESSTAGRTSHRWVATATTTCSARPWPGSSSTRTHPKRRSIPSPRPTPTVSR